MTPRVAERGQMVETQLAARGITDRHVLAAMRQVPREAFVPDELSAEAYRDGPLPIGQGQTISQPYIVALMAAAVAPKPSDVVLDVGTGSGYGAAVLSRMARQVFSIERHEPLAVEARKRLEALGYDNVSVVVGDGTLGLTAHAPYDAIVVAASGPSVPQALLAQLSIGGRLVIPVGELGPGRTQHLVRVLRTGPHAYEQTDLGPVQFVPLIGAQGWSAPSQPAS